MNEEKKGSSAYGTFTVTHDITRYTRAGVFNQVGKQTRTVLRFSTAGGEKGSADTERAPRGFALRFYTEDGHWDLAGNNTPIFFMRDPKKFSDFIHTQQRDPYTNCKSPTMMWDFWSLNPESLHQLLFLMSDRGAPYGYRHMHGFGNHTFSMINDKNERVWVKFHFKCAQGIKNFTAKEAMKMKAEDPDFAQRDLLEAIDRKEFPKWRLKIQVMPPGRASRHPFHPFDLTKTWSQKEFPLIDVGILELNENPKDYSAEMEQDALTPAQVVPGIDHAPNSFDCNGAGENDHYSQPGIFYREVLGPQEKKNLVHNIAGAMSGIAGPKRGEIIKRQLCHFFRADIGLGMAIANALGIHVDDAINQVKHQAPVAVS